MEFRASNGNFHRGMFHRRYFDLNVDCYVEDLVLTRWLTSGTIARIEVTALNHELRNDAMEWTSSKTKTCVTGTELTKVF